MTIVDTFTRLSPIGNKVPIMLHRSAGDPTSRAARRRKDFQRLVSKVEGKVNGKAMASIYARDLTNQALAERF